ncbi:MAG TPA: hypothetical protein H9835_02500, partial [Candidatus Agathobaculum merdigallinarum]|nr:hypothetical protein [Candidatus Agathobaculum merdigallinarum]
IKCVDGKLYLAAVLDCYDGAIVGFAMKRHMRAGLCGDALRNAVYRLHCSRMPRELVRHLVFRWIETYYNRRRRNTANEDNLPPLVKRARFAKRFLAA